MSIERRSRTTRALGRWLPVIAWAAMISIFSTGTFDGDSTSRLLLPWIRAILPNAPESLHLAVHAALRKLAHLTEYAVLAVLLVRARHSEERPRWSALLVDLLVCAGYAAIDELHQSMVPSRTASPIDVGIDTLGAALGLLLTRVTRRANRVARSP